MPGPMGGRGPLWDWVGLDLLTQQLENIQLTLRQQMKGIERKLDALLQGQAAGKELLMAEQEEIQNLINQVRNNKDAVDSAKTAFQGLAEIVADGQRKLEQAIANSSDVSPEIKAAADELAESTDALKQAIPAMAQAVAANVK